MDKTCFETASPFKSKFSQEWHSCLSYGATSLTAFHFIYLCNIFGSTSNSFFFGGGVMVKQFSLQLFGAKLKQQQLTLELVVDLVDFLSKQTHPKSL